MSLLAKKLGMTEIFDEDGNSIPVTVLEAGPCTVVQLKTKEKEGYASIQLGFLEAPAKLINKPLKGHFSKKNLKSFRHLKEFRLEDEKSLPEVGSELKADFFKKGDYVRVTGISKGKGFQGVIKRHGKAGGPATHGSRFHRTTGSIGQRTSPGEVFKNMKLPGHMGVDRKTVKNLKVVDVRPEENLIFLMGAVPGSNNNIVMIRK